MTFFVRILFCILLLLACNLLTILNCFLFDTICFFVYVFVSHCQLHYATVGNISAIFALAHICRCDGGWKKV